MEATLKDVDKLMKAWDDAFETKDWSEVNRLKKIVKTRLDIHFERNGIRQV